MTQQQENRLAFLQGIREQCEDFEAWGTIDQSEADPQNALEFLTGEEVDIVFVNVYKKVKRPKPVGDV